MVPKPRRHRRSASSRPSNRTGPDAPAPALQLPGARSFQSQCEKSGSPSQQANCSAPSLARLVCDLDRPRENSALDKAKECPKVVVKSLWGYSGEDELVAIATEHECAATNAGAVERLRPIFGWGIFEEEMVGSALHLHRRQIGRAHV